MTRVAAIVLFACGLGLIQASPSQAEISNVLVSNPTSSSVTITWTTTDVTDGCVRYGTTAALGDTLCDARADDDVHFVQIDGLTADTAYLFEVSSGAEVDDNDGALYAFSTSIVGSGIPYVIYGRVVLAEGPDPAPDEIVTVRVKSGGMLSEPLSVLSDPDGIWSLNLGNLKLADGSVLGYATSDSLFLDVEGAADGAVSDSTTVSGASPQDLGVVELPGDVSGVEPPVLSTSWELGQNQPNPFRDRTVIPLGLPSGLSGSRIVITDVRGRLVRSLLIGANESARGVVEWDGRTRTGERSPNGVYFYHLVTKAGARGEARQAIVVR